MSTPTSGRLAHRDQIRTARREILPRGDAHSPTAARWTTLSISESMSRASDAPYAGHCCSGISHSTKTSRSARLPSRPRTTSTRSGRLRNVKRRLPKWYAKAPNGSARSETLEDSTNRSSRSALWSLMRVPGDLVDAAHAVDRHILDQRLDREVLLVRSLLIHGGLASRGGVSETLRRLMAPSADIQWLLSN